MDRKTPHKDSVGLGAFCPLILLDRLLVRLLLALSPDPIHLQLEPSPLPVHRHLGVGRGTLGGRPQDHAHSPSL